GISELLQDPANILVEVGPGQTLSTLARQHPAKQAGQEIVASLKSEENTKPGLGSRDLRSQDIRSMLEAAGRIWSAGDIVDWAGFHGNEVRYRVPLPTYPFERQRYWIDTPPVEVAAQGSSPDNAIKIPRESEVQPMASPQPVRTPEDTLQSQQAAALMKLR